MSRIGKGYEGRFRALLKGVGARRLEQGVRWLMAKARQTEVSQGICFSAALTRVYDQLAGRPQFERARVAPAVSRFFCDAGLGGLARWLRGAGYEALWEPGIADDELLGRGSQQGAVILTTDSGLMERRVVRDGLIPALWMPPTLTIAEQLQRVFRQFGLRVRPSRCMSCGGELRRVPKEALRARIPPRTYRWLEAFYHCGRCDKVFWHGTHWERIRRQLALAEFRTLGGAPGPADRSDAPARPAPPRTVESPRDLEPGGPGP